MASTAELKIALVGQNQLSRTFDQAAASLRGLGSAVMAPARGIAAVAASIAGLPLSALGALTRGLGALGLAALGVDALAASIAGLSQAVGVGLAADFELSAARITAFTKNTAATQEIIASARAEADRMGAPFQEVLKGMTSLIPIAKSSNINLAELFRTAQLLAASDPAQGFEGAAFAIREALSGDLQSIVERFELPRERLKQLKKEGVPPLEAINRVMREMGITADLVTAQADTFIGRWNVLNNAFDDIKIAFAMPVLEALKGALTALTATLGGNKEALADFARRGGESVGQLIGQFVRALPQIVAAVTSFATWLAGPGVSALTAFTNFVQTEVLPRLLQFGEFFKAEILPRLMAFGDWFMTVGVPALRQFADFIATDVLPKMLAFGQWLQTEGLAAAQKFGAWFQSEGVPLLNAFKGLAETVGGILKDIVGPAMLVVSQNGAAILKEVGPLVTAFTDLLEALRPLGQLLGAAFGAIAASLPGILQQLTGFITSLTGLIDLIQVAVGGLSAAFQALGRGDTAGALAIIKATMEGIAAATMKVDEGQKKIAAGAVQAVAGQAAFAQGIGLGPQAPTTQRPPVMVGPPAPTQEEIERINAHREVMAGLAAQARLTSDALNGVTQASGRLAPSMKSAAAQLVGPY